MAVLVRLSPLLISILIFFSLCFFDEEIAQYIKDMTIDWSNLYAAVFDWAAIQTGFLFGVYGFIVGSPTGFMKAIDGTKPFRYFKIGLITSLVVGFVLTIISLPLLVFSPNPFTSGATVKVLSFLWFSFFVFALGTFFRSAYLFAFMTRQKESPGVDG